MVKREDNSGNWKEWNPVNKDQIYDRLRKQGKQRKAKRDSKLDEIEDLVKAMYGIADDIRQSGPKGPKGTRGRRSRALSQIYKGEVPSDEARYVNWTPIPKKHFKGRQLLDSEYVPLAFEGAITNRGDCAAVNKWGQFANKRILRKKAPSAYQRHVKKFFRDHAGEYLNDPKRGQKLMRDAAAQWDPQTQQGQWFGGRREQQGQKPPTVKSEYDPFAELF